LGNRYRTNPSNPSAHVKATFTRVSIRDLAISFLGDEKAERSPRRRLGTWKEEKISVKFSIVSAKRPSIGHLCRDNAVIEKLSIDRALGR